MKKIWLLSALVVVLGPVALAQEAALEERIAAVKASLEESQTKLRQYEWIETTVVSVDGDVKAEWQHRCYHGADGVLQKVEVGTPKEEETPRGPLRKRIAEKKKEDLDEYLKETVALLMRYVPPDPARLQHSKDAGKVSIHLLDPGKRARLDFGEYFKSGDVFGVEIDLTTNRILGAHVSTYTGTDTDDRVDLKIRFDTLTDKKTIYPVEATLDAKAKDVRVTVRNTGYRPL